MSSKTLLIVLDGFGIGKESPFNAIQNANMPFYRELVSRYPHSQLLTHGEYVGLPDRIMGNSEVGHMTMGAGRIIYQDLTRISRSVRDGSFFQNETLVTTIKAGAAKSGRVHLMGLLSDGGVHSHLSHLQALLDLCMQLQVPEVYVHAFLDGRDTPPDSSTGYIQTLLNHAIFGSNSPCKAQLASLSGRYYAMDRDKRWERVALAYRAMTGQGPACDSYPLDPLQTIAHSYSIGKTDEFVEPVLLTPKGAIKTGDSVVFFNYRSDRAREISESFTASNFTAFDRGTAPVLSAFCGMTVYDEKLGIPAAYLPQNQTHIFGEWLETHHKKQFRVAETEKYAHVTFFFNGGREQPFQGEERVLIPSPKDVPTYDLKPEMSAVAVADEASQRLKSGKYDFMLINFANADMVGHTGNYAAAVKAMEALDGCLARVIGAAERNGFHTLITADHGNAEEMHDCDGKLHTQHTLNPVPAIWVPPGSANAPKADRPILLDGGLDDVMPTLCDLMQIPTPAECQGKSLIPASLRNSYSR